MIDRVFVGSLDSEKAIVQKMVHDLLNNDPSPVNQEMKRTSEQSKKLAELRQKYLQYRSILQKKVMFMSEQMKIFPGDDDMHERIIRNQNSTTT